MVMHSEYADEDRKAVESLIRQHKLPCTIDDWLPGYKAELKSVMSKRFREIIGEEYKRIMKTNKVVKFRINPEPKKDGRRKMRLLLKGFLEPKS